MQASDIRTNFIIEYELGLSSTEDQNAEGSQSRGESASITKVQRKTKKQSRDLPPEIVNQMLSSGQKKHVLPSEVCTILFKFNLCSMQPCGFMYFIDLNFIRSING